MLLTLVKLILGLLVPQRGEVRVFGQPPCRARLRAGYMPVIVHSMERQKYYEGLRLPATQFGQVMMDAMDNSLDNACKFFIPGFDETARRKAASE